MWKPDSAQIINKKNKFNNVCKHKIGSDLTRGTVKAAWRKKN